MKRLIEEKVYKKLAKLKKSNKQINEDVINRDDFISVLQSIDGKGLSDESVQLI